MKLIVRQLVGRSVWVEVEHAVTSLFHGLLTADYRVTQEVNAALCSRLVGTESVGDGRIGVYNAEGGGFIREFAGPAGTVG